MAYLSGLIALPDGLTQPGRVSFTTAIEAVELNGTRESGREDFILPGLIDLQVNGSHGIDVMDSAEESIRAMARALSREGTTSFLPTAITAPLERIAAAHRAIAGAMAAQADGEGASILGMHLEGPFISPRRLGAHPRLSLDPEGEPLERILAMSALRLLTLAPELPGALEATRRLAARGVAVSIGHTDATFDQVQAVLGAGARMFTHTCNAMRPLHHRDPGVIAAALMPSRARAAVIPDGVHVHPALLRVILKARGADGLILTTDKTAFAGGVGLNFSGGAGARVAGGAVRLKDGTLAGSIISMLDGVRLMVIQAGAGVGEAALMAASNPADTLGLADRGRIAVGLRADLMVLSRALELKAVFVAGHEVAAATGSVVSRP